MHAGRIPPTEEWCVGFCVPLDEVETGLEELFVHGFHSFGVERAGVFNPLSTVRICPALEHSTRSELLLEFRILRIVFALRLLFGIQVIEIAEEFVEAVCSRQKLIAIAQMVLAELSRCVTEGFKQFSDGWIFRLQAKVG